jgi:phenylacetate-CoA ligase
MSVYRWLVPHVIFPLFERVTGRRIWSRVLQLRELQWRRPEELEARALNRLRSVLGHAVAHVPYYRKLFDRAGLAPEAIRRLDDLSRVPVTTKQDLRAGFPERVVADDLPASRRIPMRTSGSSGTPFVFYADRAGLDDWLASFIFFQEWAGARVWDPRIDIAGPVRQAPDYLGLPSLVHRLRGVFLGERVVTLDMVTEPDPARFLVTLESLSRHGEVVLRGYASYVARLGARVLEEKHELRAYPKAAITYGETLTASNARIIQRAFRCPVSNHYSAWELLHLAQSCPEHPELFHVNSERAIVRVVRDDGTAAPVGEDGRVVVTHLSNDVMPFINYDLGDWAVPGPPCPCRRGFPTIQSLEGRLVELIRTPSGRVFSPTAFTYVVGTRLMHPFILEYQAFQPALDRLILRIVPSPRWDAAAERLLRENAEPQLGSGIALDIEIVDQIPLETSGKRLMIKSELARGR